MTAPRPRIAITGPDGFVAQHVRCAARARWGGDLIGLGTAEFASGELMDTKIAEADAVIHLAGVNRARREEEVRSVNPWLAEQLVSSLERTGRAIPVVFGNSIHSLGHSPFGDSKRHAADILAAWGDRSGAAVADVLMPHIFGEHGVPHYNSVVATFCHQIAQGDTPLVIDDKELSLIHAQRIAGILLEQAAAPARGQLPVPGTPLLVSDVLARLQGIAADYRVGALPDLGDRLTRELFNTYRSATFPQSWPIFPTVHQDPRGALVEAVRAVGGQTQVFYSSTNPGRTRGQHFHLHKVERFLVLRGQAEIRLRRVLGDEVVSFHVTGARPALIDMPTMWVHSITNTGPDELITLFYADETFDPERADTYSEEV